MNLYHGGFADTMAPWPTARVPRGAVEEEEEERGWEVLAEAERALRRGNEGRGSLARTTM